VPKLGPLSSTERTRHHRLREQGRTDRGELAAVLRAGLIAHLGVQTDQGFMVVPTVYGFDERQVYVHGSVASRSLAADMPEVCLSITIVDGLMLARSVFEPLDTRWLQPVPDPALPAGLRVPAHIAARAGNAAHPR
jgi:uncharacterized protein